MAEKTIWKYPLRVYVETRDSVQVAMPQGADILCVRDQESEICLWALVDCARPKEMRRFRVYKTNRPVDPDDIYIGSVAMHGLVPIFHVFESFISDL